MSELTRANKVTAYWEAGSVACAIFYKTHDKIKTIRSTDVEVMTAGFQMLEGTDEAPVTAQQKLQSFKDFVAANAAVFGIQYDPVDRRADEFKFPSRYDANNVLEYAEKVLGMALDKVTESIQNNVVERMIKSGHLAEGAAIGYAVGDAQLDITENYANGFIKYATISYPVALTVDGNTANTTITVELVSGQLKKPRNIGDTVMTMTGVKELLIESGVLPKIEPKAKKSAAVDTEGEDVDGDATPDEE